MEPTEDDTRPLNPQPPARKRIYEALLVLLGIAVLRGLLTAEEAEEWVRLIAITLGTGGLGLARRNVS